MEFVPPWVVRRVGLSVTVAWFRVSFGRARYAGPFRDLSRPCRLACRGVRVSETLSPKTAQFPMYPEVHRRHGEH